MFKLYLLFIVGVLTLSTSYAQECDATAQNDDRCTQSGKYVARDRFGEVIISAGTINSAQLLMLSGIGPFEQLKSVGVFKSLIFNMPLNPTESNQD